MQKCYEMPSSNIADEFVAGRNMKLRIKQICSRIVGPDSRGAVVSCACSKLEVADNLTRDVPTSLNILDAELSQAGKTAN